MIAFRIIRWSVAYVFRAMADDDWCWTCVKPRWCCDCKKAAR